MIYNLYKKYEYQINSLTNQNKSLPSFAFGLLILVHPGFSPGVCKVNDKHQLDENKQEPTNHAKVHPHLSKVSMRDEECSNYGSNQHQVFDAPKPVQRNELT